MSADFAAAFEGLQQRFLRRAATDLEELLHYRSGRDGDANALKFIVHRLAGAAATFGFQEVSFAASSLEADWQSRNEIDPTGLDALIAELRKLPPWQPDQ